MDFGGLAGRGPAMALCRDVAVVLEFSALFAAQPVDGTFFYEVFPFVAARRIFRFVQGADWAAETR